MKNKLVFVMPAGGLGSRLMPLTKDMPKGNLPIYFNEKKIIRMIDLSLSYCKEKKYDLYININHNKEGYSYLNNYSNVHIIDKKYDDLYSCLYGILCHIRKREEFCVVACDFLIPICWLDRFISLKKDNDSIILVSKRLILKPFRKRTSEGFNTFLEGELVSDLGFRVDNVNYWKKVYRKYKIKRNKTSFDMLLNLNRKCQLVLFDNLTHIDIGTPEAYYEALMKLNKDKLDSNGNLIFPGASINPKCRNVIALPNSKSNLILNNCILPENKEVVSLDDVLVVPSILNLFNELQIADYIRL